MLRIELSGAQRTLLIPLYARALDFRSPRSILHDRSADEIARRIDFDFSTLGHWRGSPLLAVRARQLDEWASEYLTRRPGATVLNLGCGLDARFERVRPPPSVRWFDVDYPEVIDLRRNFYSETPNHRMLATSLTAPEWLGAVDPGGPGLAIADGVFEYMAEGEVAGLLGRLVERWSEGEVAFDVMGRRTVRSVNRRLDATVGGRIVWSADDLRSVDALEPRLRRTAARSVFETPYTPAAFRTLAAVLFFSPGLRRAIRLLRYEFP